LRRDSVCHHRHLARNAFRAFDDLWHRLLRASIIRNSFWVAN
jgi:hypothetical protein